MDDEDDIVVEEVILKSQTPKGIELVELGSSSDEEEPKNVERNGFVNQPGIPRPIVPWHLRHSVQQRFEESRRRRRRNSNDYEIAEVSSEGRLLVNAGKPASDPEVYVAEHLTNILQPHQLGGVKFMYDNVIESLESFNTSEGFGCILAHCMGLGKTLQVIAFIDIFFRYTTLKRVIVVCPVNTIQNWAQEFEKWLPEKNAEGNTIRTFRVFLLGDSVKGYKARAEFIKKWFKEGGVLLISYDMFKLLPFGKKVKKTAKPFDGVLDSMVANSCGNTNSNTNAITSTVDDGATVSEKGEQIIDSFKLQDELKQALVDPGADLIICDEGHQIKNMKTNKSASLSAVKTKRRIVLTGYPLQNNLIEYYCMVNFVRPGYLGTKKYFSQMFEKPINAALGNDASPRAIKLCKQRTHVLQQKLSGFVQRRTQHLLKKILPDSREYVIFVRKSLIQQKLYHAFVSETNTDIVDQNSSFNPLKAHTICVKILNHPDMLYNAREERKKRELARNVRIDNLFRKDAESLISDTANNHINGTNEQFNKNSLFSTNNSNYSNSIYGRQMPESINHCQQPSTSNAAQNELYLQQNFDSNGIKQSMCMQYNPYNLYQIPKDETHNSNNRSWIFSNQNGFYQSPSLKSIDFTTNQYNMQNLPIQQNSSFNTADSSINCVMVQQSFLSMQQDNNNLIASFPQYQLQQSGGQSMIQSLPTPVAYSTNYQQQQQQMIQITNQELCENKQFFVQPQQQIGSVSAFPTATTTAPSPSSSTTTTKARSFKFSEIIEQSKCDIVSNTNEPFHVSNFATNSSTMPNGIEQKKKRKMSCDIIDQSYDSQQPSTSVESASIVSISTSMLNMNRGRGKATKSTKLTLADALFDCDDEKIDGSIKLEWTDYPLLNYHPGVLQNGSKMELAFSIIDETTKRGEKILLFSSSVNSLNVFESFLSIRQFTTGDGINHQWRKNINYCRFDGKTTGIERERLIEQFNRDPQLRLFLISTKAGSLGINLVSASRVIIFDASWNPCDDAQAICRIYRYGQRKRTFIYRLIMSNSMEKAIFYRQIAKSSLQQKVVDQQDIDANVSTRELETLFYYDEATDLRKPNLNIEKWNLEDDLLANVANKNLSLFADAPFLHESMMLESEEKLSEEEKLEAELLYEREMNGWFTWEPHYPFSSSSNFSHRGFTNNFGRGPFSAGKSDSFNNSNELPHLFPQDFAISHPAAAAFNKALRNAQENDLTCNLANRPYYFSPSDADAMLMHQRLTDPTPFPKSLQVVDENTNESSNHVLSNENESVGDDSNNATTSSNKIKLIDALNPLLHSYDPSSSSVSNNGNQLQSIDARNQMKFSTNFVTNNVFERPYPVAPDGRIIIVQDIELPSIHSGGGQELLKAGELAILCRTNNGTYLKTSNGNLLDASNTIYSTFPNEVGNRLHIRRRMQNAISDHDGSQLRGNDLLSNQQQKQWQKAAFNPGEIIELD